MAVALRKNFIIVSLSIFITMSLPSTVITDTLSTWLQSTWHGGPGQRIWEDTTRFYLGNTDWSSPGDLRLQVGWIPLSDLSGPSGIWCLLRTGSGTLLAGTGWDGYVYRSTDNGVTWDSTGGKLASASIVSSLLETSIGTIYAGTGYEGDIFESTDDGVTWTLCADLPNGGHWISALIEDINGSIYAAWTRDEGGKIYKSTDGTHWDTTASLQENKGIFSLLQASDSALYAGSRLTVPYTTVFKSTDWGVTWSKTSIDTGGKVEALIEAPDGKIYSTPAQLSGLGGGGVWVTSNGYEWERLNPLLENSCYSLLLSGDTLYVGVRGSIYLYTNLSTSPSLLETWISSTSDIYSMIEAPDDKVYAAGWRRFFPDSEIYQFPGGYSSGYLESSVYSIPGILNYGQMHWGVTLNGQSVVMRVRTSSDSLMSGAMEWTECDTVINGQFIETLNSVNSEDKHIQYRADMESANPDTTPLFHSVYITYSTERIKVSSDTINFKYKKMLLVIDDSVYSDYGFIDDPSWKEAVRLEVPMTASIIALWYYPVDPYGENPPLQWRVWDDDGIARRPGTLIGSGNTTPQYDDWFKVAVHPPITVGAGNVYVGWDAAGQGIWYANALDSQLNNYNWWWDGTMWKLDSYFSGDLMIRAEVTLGLPQDSTFLRVYDIAPEDSLHVDDIVHSTSWLSVYPTSFDLAPGEYIDLTVAVDVTDLQTGIYYDTLHILSDDPFIPDKEVVIEYDVETRVEEAVESEDARGYFVSLAGPNPMSGFTAILYGVPKKERVSLKVYNALGQLVRTLVDETKQPGYHKSVWDGKNSEGKKVSAGVYFCEFATSEFRQTRKLVTLE